MKKRKFKVDDRVKILPSAREVSIRDECIGSIGIIIVVINNDYDYTVKVGTRYWYCRKRDMEHVIPVGQQLEFDFMEE